MRLIECHQPKVPRMQRSWYKVVVDLYLVEIQPRSMPIETCVTLSQKMDFDQNLRCSLVGTYSAWL